ncbi:hypothetical protein EX30DRAFT_57073 [Ascodesmis nigricans]|uniref:Uncharacterized protein n=1 Tax=Ascodesmis nigricans TaxID=341454 RepID=A0A4S2MUZ3_9PEZI|nr:hypothetical protein EX30DRAFT_57073 [Ascodesmis nigricans]
MRFMMLRYEGDLGLQLLIDFLLMIFESILFYWVSDYLFGLIFGLLFQSGVLRGYGGLLGFWIYLLLSSSFLLHLFYCCYIVLYLFVFVSWLLACLLYMFSSLWSGDLKLLGLML